MGVEPVQVSVVVCTYDRARMLERCVLSLVTQTLDPSLFEIIVVDNGSSDDTQQVVRSLESTYPKTRISLACQPLRGLGNARNAGARAAAGRYVAYIDDDAVAAPDWLATALGAMCATTPHPMVVGGPIMPRYDDTKPAWFRDEYEIRTWGSAPRFLGEDETFSGSNMVLDRQALERHGGFAVHLGMVGGYVSVGEETHLFRKMRQNAGSDAAFFYSPTSVVYHSVPGNKMTVKYQLGRALMAGHAGAREASPSAALTMRAVLLLPLRIGLLGMAAFRRRGNFATCENWAVETLQPVAAQMGWTAGCLRLRLRMRR